MTPDDVLDEAKQLISGERKDTYGDATETHRRIGQAWSAVLGLSDRTIEPHEVALMMICLKAIRASRTADHKDSWVDLAGYAALGGAMNTTDQVVIVTEVGLMPPFNQPEEN